MAKFAVGERAILLNAVAAPQFTNEIVEIISIPSKYGTSDCSIKTPDGDKWACDFSSLRKLPPDDHQDTSEDVGLTRLKKHINLWTEEAKVKKPSPIKAKSS